MITEVPCYHNKNSPLKKESAQLDDYNYRFQTHMDQQPKNRQLEIINSIVDNMNILQNLSAEETSLLIKLYHLQAYPTLDSLKIRNALIQVFLFERQDYVEYLRLRKFQSLPDSLIQKLTMFFQQVWSKFSEQINKRNNPQVIVNPTSFTPFLMNNTSSDIKDPNIDCYNFYRPFPYQVSYDSKLTFQQYPYYYNFSHPYSTSYTSKPLDYAFSPQPLINPLQSSHHQKLIECLQIQPQQQSAAQLQFKREYQSVSNQIELPKQQGLKIININFLHCVCQGIRVQQDLQHYECPCCHKLYHLQCLGITKKEIACPLCTLSSQHIFTQTNPRIIKSGWAQVKSEEQLSLKIKLTSQQMQIFRTFLNAQQSGRNGFIQFRMIKAVDNKPDIQQRKKIRACFPMSINQLKKIKARGQIEVRMRQFSQSSLTFYAVVFTRYKEQSEIQADYLKLNEYNELKSNWEMKQKDEGKQIIIDLIHPQSNKLISLPIRGEFCTHLECEDLLYFQSTFKSKNEPNNRLICSYCNKIYTPNSLFFRDSTIFNLLKNNQAGRQRIALKKGQVTWLQNEPQPMQQEDEIKEQQPQQKNPLISKPIGKAYLPESSSQNSPSDSQI